MKKTLFMELLVLTLFTFLLSACGGNQDNGNPTMPDICNPAIADWVISFTSLHEAKEDHVIFIYWNGVHSQLPQNTQVQLKINGEEIPLDSCQFEPGNYLGLYNLNSGTTYRIEFSVNNILKAQTDLRMVYQASANFPNTFNPASSFAIDWSLSANNQYQIAVLSSWHDEDQEDEYHKDLSPSARSYTFPANAVQNFGSGTEYGVYLTQANLKLVNKIACLSTHTLGADYYMKNGELDFDRTMLRARNLSKQLLDR